MYYQTCLESSWPSLPNPNNRHRPLRSLGWVAPKQSQDRCRTVIWKMPAVHSLLVCVEIRVVCRAMLHTARLGYIRTASALAASLVSLCREYVCQATKVGKWTRRLKEAAQFLAIKLPKIPCRTENKVETYGSLNTSNHYHG